MVRCLVLAAMLLSSSPALADCGELSPVPAGVLIGHAYQGDNRASEIRFINVRNRPVSIVWIAFDGSEHPYRQLNPGDEMLQPTFVDHRWLARDVEGAPLEAFVSTCSITQSGGSAQVALIR